MKTKQEILDFYGVEIGKRYRITNTNFKFSGTNIFTVGECQAYFGGLVLRFEDDNDTVHSLTLLNEYCYEEIRQPILDDVEREYLQHYVMDNPTFKGKVDSIVKDGDDFYDALVIHLNNCGYGFLPRFKKNTMYKNMKLNKDYTPKELGLKE